MLNRWLAFSLPFFSSSLPPSPLAGIQFFSPSYLGGGWAESHWERERGGLFSLSLSLSLSPSLSWYETKKGEWKGKKGGGGRCVVVTGERGKEERRREGEREGGGRK